MSQSIGLNSATTSNRPSAPHSTRIVVASLRRLRGPLSGAYGVQTHIRVLLEYLSSVQQPAELVTPYTYGAGLVAAPIFAVRRLLWRPNGPLGHWWFRYWHGYVLELALRLRLARQTADEVVIYAQCPVAAAAALKARAAAGARRRCRVVMAAHFNISQAAELAEGGMIRENDWLYRQIKRFEARVLPQLDAIVYVSAFLKCQLEADIPAVAHVPSIVVPNFVFPPTPKATPGLRSDLISIGTLEARKNQAYLLHVLSEAAGRGRRYSLSVVGDGPDRHQLERLAAELGLREQVHFLGQQPNAARLLAGHRAYVHAAVMENLPIALIEALAASLPVLAAPVGGIPELLSDGVEGRYWPLDDPATGAERLVELLENPVQRERYAQAAARRYALNHHPVVAAGRLAEFLSAQLA